MRGWYKDTTRMEEIKTLLQGFQIPPPPPVSAAEPLPAARVCPSSPPNVQEPFSFSEPLDTTGKAKVRSRTSSPMQLPSSAALSSSTSKWRKRKAEAEGRAQFKEVRKVYTCRVYSKPMTSEGHTQFRGRRYCPNAPVQVPRE
ncbi:unnamed protein product [Pocillopora meandrina]|uniref:Uncharacterized protein n=1 Tax=Pocillopora meandrina TaxID=46732 RepID=A0AAU9VJP0_9CNID|nr:unnamed protein product [Pocillopora meandrina]